MLTQQAMVYFAPGPWAGLWRNRHQLMHLFARHGNRVLFVEGRGHLRQTLAAIRTGQAGLTTARIEPVADDLFVFRYPVWTPISGHPQLGWMTQKLRTILLRHALAELGLARPIVWFSQPSMGDLLDAVPDARLRIYHVVDEYAAYTGQSPEHSRREQLLEQELIRRVDAVVVVSEKLYAAKRHLHPHTYLVPNGVDYGAYSAALEDAHSPDDLARIPAPRLVYSGLIGDRLDLEMLAELARTRPDWSLVLLGEARLAIQQAQWDALCRLPNVHYLGQKPVQQVPYYLKGCQVGMMPYLQNRESEHISPLKLYDYLAAGLPVASMDIPAVREFRAAIHVAAEPAAFAGAVAGALADTAPARRAQRRALAAQHTWEARGEQISGLIREQLQWAGQTG